MWLLEFRARPETRALAARSHPTSETADGANWQFVTSGSWHSRYAIPASPATSNCGGSPLVGDDRIVSSRA